MVKRNEEITEKSQREEITEFEELFNKAIVGEYNDEKYYTIAKPL